MRKRKKVVYREKQYNVDTLIVNALNIMGRLGIKDAEFHSQGIDTFNRKTEEMFRSGKKNGKK